MSHRIFIETNADYADPLGLDARPRTSARHTLSSDQLAALRAFADANGRTWKASLNLAWSTGRYHEYNGLFEDGSLQQVRNTFGPSWLKRFSFDKVSTHSVQG